MTRRILAGIGLAAVCFVLLPWAVVSLWQPRELPSKRFLSLVKVGVAAEQVHAVLPGGDGLVRRYGGDDFEAFVFADETTVFVTYDFYNTVIKITSEKPQPFWQPLWEHFFPPEPPTLLSY